MADRETIIETGGGSNMGIIGGVAVVLVLAVLAFFIFGNNGGSRTDNRLPIDWKKAALAAFSFVA